MEGKRQKPHTEDITRKTKSSEHEHAHEHEHEEIIEDVFEDEVEEAYTASNKPYPPRPHRPFFKDVSFLGVLFQIVVVSAVIGIIAGIVFYAPHFLTLGISTTNKPEVVIDEAPLDDSLTPPPSVATSTQATSTSPAPTETVKKLRIRETETGWLNVRATPSPSGTRVTRVSPRTEYEYKDTKDGWYLIVVDAKTEGWVLGEYIELIK
jgi:hypothetical protein